MTRIGWVSETRRCAPHAEVLHSHAKRVAEAVDGLAILAEKGEPCAHAIGLIVSWYAHDLADDLARMAGLNPDD